MTTHTSLLRKLALVCLVAAWPAVAAEPTLPKGAVVRFGTDQFRHGGPIFLVHYALGGKAIVTASDANALRLWDAATGKELRRLELTGKPPITADMPEMDLAKALEQLGFKEENDLGTVAQIVSHLRAAVSPDGRLIAATRGGPVFLWEAETGKLLHQLEIEDNAPRKRLVFDVKFAPDGKTVAGVGTDLGTFSWDVATGKPLRSESDSNRPHLGKLILDGIGMPTLTDDVKVLAWLHQDEKLGKTTLKRLDLTTGKYLTDVKLPQDGFDLWCLSPDGKTLAWHDPSSLDVVVCDVANPRKKKKLKPKDEDDVATALRFAADGKSLAVRRYGRGLEVWDVAAAKPKPLWRKPGVVSYAGEEYFDLGQGQEVGAGLAFAPDGKSLAVSFGTARLAVWDAVTGKPAPGLEGGHLSGVTVLGPCRDGKAVLTFSPGDGARLWDAATGQLLNCPLKLENAWAASLSADGKRLVSIDPEGAEVWDVDAGKSLHKITGGDNQFDALDLSPDGQTVALHAVQGWTVRLHSTETGKELCRAQTGEPFPEDGTGVPDMISAVMVSDLVFSPDSRYLAGPGARQQLCVWHAATGALAFEAPLPPGQSADTFTFTGQGRGLAVLFSDGGLAVYETATGRQRLRVEPAKKDQTDEFRDPYYSAMASSPDGRLLAVSRDDGPIALWDLTTGREVIQVTGHEASAMSLQFTADGRRLLSGSKDATALLWDVTQLAPRPPAQALDDKLLDNLWVDLEGENAEKAHKALSLLSTSPGQAAALVGAKVRPAAPPDRDRVARLLTDLSDDNFSVRQKAAAELESLGDLIESALRQALEKAEDLDIRRKLEVLLDKAAGGVATPDRVRTTRALELLEAAGGAEARRVLERLAAGAADARMTRDARAALGRFHP